MYTTSAASFPQNKPIPVLEPALKTGNGKTTFKTATAAANAAREARDEARAALEEVRELSRQCAGQAIKCMHHANESEEFVNELFRISKGELKFKIALITAVLADIIFQVSVLLMT